MKVFAFILCMGLIAAPAYGGQIDRVYFVSSYSCERVDEGIQFWDYEMGKWFILGDEDYPASVFWDLAAPSREGVLSRVTFIQGKENVLGFGYKWGEKGVSVGPFEFESNSEALQFKQELEDHNQQVKLLYLNGCEEFVSLNLTSGETKTLHVLSQDD